MVSKAKLDGRQAWAVASPCYGQVALEASLQVLNSGVGAWPERTMLKRGCSQRAHVARLIHGVGMGLPSLPGKSVRVPS